MLRSLTKAPLTPGTQICSRSSIDEPGSLSHHPSVSAPIANSYFSGAGETRGITEWH